MKAKANFKRVPRPKILDKWNFPADADTVWWEASGPHPPPESKVLPHGTRSPNQSSTAEDMVQTLKTLRRLLPYPPLPTRRVLGAGDASVVKMPSSPLSRTGLIYNKTSPERFSRKENGLRPANSENSRRKSPATRSCPTWLQLSTFAGRRKRKSGCQADQFWKMSK